MAKQSLLVADADPRSLRILDVALRKAGFQVSTASDGAEALRRIQRTPPDLLLADVSLPGTDGVALCRAVRADARLAGTPVILISSSKEAALKLSAHEAGADDFLGKPLLIKELTARIRMLLTRREQQKLAQRGEQGVVTGEIAEMGLVDLIQSLDANRQSALIACDDGERNGQIWVRDGQVVDAEAGALAGEAAFYRVLGWEAGKFSAGFAPIDREARIGQATQALLAESVRRVDELGRLSEELPLTTVLSVDFPALARRLADLPDEVNGVIRLCDGLRSIAQVMDRAPIDELSVLAVLQRLLGEKVLQKVEPALSPRSKPSLLQWLGPDSVATPAPPIMGAHGFPQSGDPTPIAPPVSDPPLPAAERPRASADSPTLSLDTTPADPVRAFDTTPAEPVRVFETPAAPAPAAPAAVAPSDRITPPQPHRIAEEPAAQRQLPLPSAPPPVRTDLFKLPSTPKAPVPLVRFAPLRGVRRERLRREADEARALVAEGKPVRLTHVVELPAFPAAAPDPRRRISPAVGEAAKKFAPDVALGMLEPSAAAPEPEPMLLVPMAEGELAALEIPESAPAAPAQPHLEELPPPDDRDVFTESATVQVEPLSSDALSAAASLAAPAPAPAPLAAATPAAAAPEPAATPTAVASEPPAAAAVAAAPEEAKPAVAPAPAAEPESAAAAPSPWDESTDPLAVAPFSAAITAPGVPAPVAGEAPLSHDAPTAPGHRIEIPAEPSAPAATAPAAEALPEGSGPHVLPPMAAAEPAPEADERAELAPIPGPPEERPVAPPPSTAELAAAAVTAEGPPLKLPVQATPSPDDDFDAEMRAALGKNKRRWPLYVALAAAALALFFFFRPQPPTDKKDAPWLDESAAKPAVPAPAPAPAPMVPAAAPVDAGPQQASAVDAGPAPLADAGALAAAPTPPAAPVDAGPELPAAPPPSDDYARALANGESLLKRGKYRPAVAELKKAVALNPEAVPALLELGDAWLESDQPRSALKPLEKAAKLDPHSSRAQLLLGTAWQSLGKNGEAVKSYQRYLEMDPSGEYARDVRSILANLQK